MGLNDGGALTGVDPAAAADILRDWIVLESLQDLRELTTGFELQPRRYLLMRMSGVIRKLFLDNAPAGLRYLKANKMRPRFLAHKYDPNQILPGAIWQLHGDGIVPGNDSTTVVHHSWDSFLRHQAGMLADGTPITVKQLIRFTAHVDGGVHLGAPSNAVERAFLEISHIFVAPKMSTSVLRGSPAGMMYPISRIILDGMREAQDALWEWRKAGAGFSTSEEFNPAPAANRPHTRPGPSTS